ncbi:MAG: hypothetical protein ACJ8R9_31030 [Steroidobacteraceae bacterium]
MDKNSEAENPNGTTNAGSAGRSATTYLDVVHVVVTDEKLSPKEKSALLHRLELIQATASRVTSRTAMIALGLIAGAAIVGIIILSLTEKTMPEGLIAIGSSAVGGLAGLVSHSKSPQAHSASSKS